MVQESSHSISPIKPAAGPSREAIEKQMLRIQASSDFHATDQQREFFQFVVLETFAGRSHEIKGYTVATHVFGRKADFDPTYDPIVSIQANKLRRALERYYLTAGKHDSVRIDIPKGAYVPTFHEQTGIETKDSTPVSGKSAQKRFEGSWPTVLVRPFQNLTGDPGMNYLGIGLATELAVEVARFQEIRVFLCGLEGHESMPSEGGARFTLDGNIRKDRTGIKVAVHLTDTTTNRQIWGDMHLSALEAAQLISFQEEVAGVIAAKVAGEHGIISKTLSAESRNIPPTELKTYEAILRYYEYDLTLSPDSFVRALEALERARNFEPQCGQVWSLLGRLYGNIYSLELLGFETALEKATLYAEKGVRLNPDNQRARTTLALVRMFSDEIPAALADVEQAMALNPNSLFILDGIGYIMTLLGEWEHGPALIRNVIRRNPYYGLYVHYALWVDWIRQGKDEEAYLETLNFRRPALFWEPLMRATSFGRLGRIEEGKRATEELLKLKPDFPTRGRGLIGHYIKFDEIVERTIDGLSKVGLIIE